MAFKSDGEVCVAHVPDGVRVYGSANPNFRLAFTAEEWDAFLCGLVAGEFNGTPVVTEDEKTALMLRKDGMTCVAIAHQLNQPGEAKWDAVSVSKAIQRAAKLLEEETA